MAPRSIGPLAVVVAVLIMLVLGGSFAVVKIGLRDLPSLGLLGFRMLVGAAVLAAAMVFMRLPFLYRGVEARFVAAQTGFFVVQQALLYYGLAFSPAGRAAILFNTQPFMTMLLLPIFLSSERVDGRRLAGTAAAFAGVVLVLSTRQSGAGSILGDVLVLLAAASWAANVILNRTMPGALHPVVVIFWSCLGCAPVALLLGVLVQMDSAWSFGVDAVASILYLGILGSIAFVLFVWLTKTYSPIRVNPFAFLSPVFAVLIGWGALDEELTWSQVVGVAAVAAGIWVVNTEPRKAAR
jgi:drug/metabolite transporter (DMT)-like permease